MLTKIKDKYLEFSSFIILMLWVISPLIEYFLKIGYRHLYTHYFTTIIYIGGSVGIILYIIYLAKLIKSGKINIKKFIPELILFTLLIISIISTIVSKDSYMSFYGETYRKEGLLVYIMYIGFLLSASIIKDSKYLNYVFKTMIIVCLIITINPIFGSKFTYLKFTNIFHNPNHYGYYLMINTMIALFMFINNNKLIKKVIYMLIYIFFLYLLLRNDTFGSYLAILATLIFLFIYSMIKKHNRLKVLLVIIIFIVTSFSVSHFDIKIGEKVNFKSTKGFLLEDFFFLVKDVSDITDDDGKVEESAGSYRIILWKEAWNYTLEHPIFGGGMECLKYYYMGWKKGYYAKYNDRPHNSIIQAAAFIGIPGAIVYLTFILYIAISNLILLKKDNLHIMIYCTAMCYFLSSLLGNSMYYTSPYFVILLGLLIGFRRNKIELAKS